MKCKIKFATLLFSFCLVFVTLLNTTQGVAQTKTSEKKPGDIDRTVIPLAEPKFGGTIDKTYKESKGEWPKLPAPPKGAPNVVVILLDDVGFGQVSTYGGPIPTPELDKLATQGLRYTRFHTTAICVLRVQHLLQDVIIIMQVLDFWQNGPPVFQATTV